MLASAEPCERSLGCRPEAVSVGDEVPCGVRPRQGSQVWHLYDPSITRLYGLSAHVWRVIHCGLLTTLYSSYSVGTDTAMGNGTCASHTYSKEPLGLSCDFDTIPNCVVAKRDIEDMVSWDIDHLKVLPVEAPYRKLPVHPRTRTRAHTHTPRFCCRWMGALVSTG